MGTNLYVGNLPFSASQDEVRDLFENEGCSVTSVNLINDRETGRPRGFGFVETATPEDAQKAIQALDGREFGGRSLKVNEARSRQGGGGGNRRPQY
ncbi:MAG: RNA-binding protein [Acidobacteriota bacterium]|nr:MAG: RNA-binding protein [Acidobacteriota bacterium]